MRATARYVRERLKRSSAYLDFAREYRQFRALSRAATPRFHLAWSDRHPCLDDRTASTLYDRHYVLHPAWAARVLAETRPSVHVDISSTLQFCSIVSAFVPVRFYDYRPANLGLSNLSSERADLAALPFADQSIHSLSCMHVVEHVGLGRYGDALDPDADLKAMAELARVVAPGGSLLFVVPVGAPVVRFNAHRVYQYDQVVSGLEPLKLREYRLIPDDPRLGQLVEDPDGSITNDQTYGCGCFWFQRLP